MGRGSILPGILLLGLLSACGGSSKLASGEGIYWINSLEKDCERTGQATCLEVQPGPEIDAGGWNMLPGRIDGFDFQEGYLYKVVLRGSWPDEQLHLVSILERRADHKLALEGRWVARSMGGDPLNPDLGIPELEIRLRENQYLGSDGCNRYMGSIALVGEGILSFGVAAGTRMACPDMGQSDRYNQALTDCRGYGFNSEELQLLDDEGNEILGFSRAEQAGLD